MRVFKVLYDKSYVKLKSGEFWTLFLVQFPYKNRAQNHSFQTFSKEKYREGRF